MNFAFVDGHFYRARHGRIVGPAQFDRTVGWIIAAEFTYLPDGRVSDREEESPHDLIEDVTAAQYLASPEPGEYTPNPNWLAGFAAALEVHQARGFIHEPYGTYPADFRPT